MRPEDFTIANVHERFARTRRPVRGHALRRLSISVRRSRTLGLETSRQLGARGDVGAARAKLADYDAKREFDVTPEPQPSVTRRPPAIDS